jgi:dihydropteroate synthase-like protein
MGDDFEYEIAVMRISVAALMTMPWIARSLSPPAGCDRILLPGRCEGDPQIIGDKFGIPAEKGPKDLRDIPLFFGREAQVKQGYGEHDIQILAEINNANSWERQELLGRAGYYRACGADFIDMGCTPGQPFHLPYLAEVVGELRAADYRVSIDSFDRGEIETAVEAGAELVLSVNRSNLDVARGLGVAVVVIPDDPDGENWEGELLRSVEQLEAWGTSYVIDPIINPLMFGFSASLGRFLKARERFPAAEMMMGIGNLTELTDADSVGINAMLIGFCQELGVRYVLTTEVIPWARGAVREVDIARRLMYFAQRQGIIPKHLEEALLTIKDPYIKAYAEEELRGLHAAITDPNFRIFTDEKAIYVFNNELFVKGVDIQGIFDQLGVEDPAHAFYLGWELMKARLAVQLGKSYVQEEPLRWGYLTPEEEPPRPVKLERRLKKREG